MSEKGSISRRQFVTAAACVAAASTLPGRALGHIAPAEKGSSQETLKLTESPGWRDQGIENLAKSPHAKLRDIPVRAVTITGGFWGPRRDINVTRSIPTMHDLLEANGRMNNFRRLVGKSQAAQHGPVFSDSDVYKWTEAVGFVLQSGDRPALHATAEKIIDEVVAVQEPNGYLNTYYQDDRKPLRMLPQTQSTGHELYNIGHMLQGAIAYYRATGDRNLLDAGIRFVNDFLIPNYGPAPKTPIVSGHPEIELALIELYRITGDKRQLELAGYILQGVPERFAGRNDRASSYGGNLRTWNIRESLVFALQPRCPDAQAAADVYSVLCVGQSPGQFDAGMEFIAADLMQAGLTRQDARGKALAAAG